MIRFKRRVNWQTMFKYKQHLQEAQALRRHANINTTLVYDINKIAQYFSPLSFLLTHLEGLLER
jgi:hypothetical protein